MKSRQFAWGVMTTFAVSIGAYALAVLAGIVPNDFLDKFADYRAVASLHFLGGGIALLFGPWQFSAKLRRRSPSRHRWSGRLYLLGVLGSAGAGLYMAPRADGGLPAAWGFGTLAVLWIVTAALAFSSIRAGKVEEHRRWMVRNFALTYAAVMLRLYIPLAAAAGYGFDAAYPVIAWICWVPNLIVADWLLLAPVARGAASARAGALGEPDSRVAVGH